ncbi:MAG: hypothetical protein ACE5LU_09085 [Anaerolineae bacterium]
MTSTPRSSRVSLLLTSLLAVVVTCVLAWSAWKAARPLRGLMRPLTAHATDESLWQTVGGNIPVLRKSADQEWPAIAYNTQDNEYLVVWQDQINFDTTRNDVFARRLAIDGTPIGDAFAVTRQALNQDFPSVAYNRTRNEYLVVWSDQRDVRISGSDVYGQRVGADGTLAGSDIAISTALRPQLYPRVAYNPDADEFLVVWQDSRTSATTSSDIFGQRVAGDGSLLGANFAISDNPEAQNQPDVAYSPATQRYLVAWDDERGADLTDVDVYAQLVTGTGAPDGTNIVVSTAAINQENVGIGYNTDLDEFLVVWEDSRGLSITNTDIYGQRVDATGILRGDNIALSTGNRAESDPVLAFDASLSGYLLVWRDDRNEPGTGGDIFGRALNGIGEQVGDEFEIAVEIGTQRRAQVARNTKAGEFLVVWEDPRNFWLGGSDPYAQRIGPGVALTATPTNTATATNTPTVTLTATATPGSNATPTFVALPTSTLTPTPSNPTNTPTPAGPTSTPTATPRPPTPTSTPVGYPGPTRTPRPGGPGTSYLPLIWRSHLPCGFNTPDADEPANNLWESATPYGYGRWDDRTFWDLSASPGQQGNDVDWYEWVVEWTGPHWIWPENMSYNVEVYAEVFYATGDARRPLELLAFGKGKQEVELQAGNTYYVKVKNVGSNPPAVGCYDLILDP